MLFLFIYMTIVTLIVKQYSGDDSLQKGIGVTGFASMIVYATIAKRFHFDRRKKGGSLVILFILLNIGGIYLGRYYYQTSASMSEVNKVINGLSLLKAQEKEQDLTQLRNTISVLTESIKTNPQNIEQAKKHVAVVDQLLPLYKRSYDSTKHVYEQMLELISSVKTVQDIKKVEGVLQVNGLNMSALAPFLKQLDKWYEALTANLNARKEYYESFIKHESSQTQDYLFRKWSALEDAYLQEESKLVRIQSELKTRPNMGAQRQSK